MGDGVEARVNLLAAYGDHILVMGANEQSVRLSGKRALLEQLRADGVRHVFGNPGTTEQPFMDALPDFTGIQFVLKLHEGVWHCPWAC